jgi:hypothetical protein
LVSEVDGTILRSDRNFDKKLSSYMYAIGMLMVIENPSSQVSAWSFVIKHASLFMRARNARQSLSFINAISFRSHMRLIAPLFAWHLTSVLLLFPTPGEKVVSSKLE